MRFGDVYLHRGAVKRLLGVHVILLIHEYLTRPVRRDRFVVTYILHWDKHVIVPVCSERDQVRIYRGITNIFEA